MEKTTYIILDKMTSLGDEPGHPCVNIVFVTHKKALAEYVLKGLRKEWSESGSKKWPRFEIYEKGPFLSEYEFDTLKDFVYYLMN